MKLFYSLFIIIITSANLYAQDDSKIQLANEYYLNDDFEKAKDIYDELVKDFRNIPSVHNNYFDVLISLNDYKSAEKYIKKAKKAYPSNIYYRIDEGTLLTALNKKEQADKIYRELITEIKTNGFLVRTAAQYFISKQLTSYALDTYIQARKNNPRNTEYALELANTYRILGDKEKMINEYLIFASLRKQNLRYVKNILQGLLKNQEDMRNFQNTLLDQIQRNQSNEMYSDLLIWAYMQQRDFLGAFVQAKAITRRFKENGYRLMDIGAIALKNESFTEAEEIFEHVVEKMPESTYYLKARRQLIKTRQEKIKKSFPVDSLAIRQLTYDYQQLIAEEGFKRETIEAYRQKALLHAFYLGEKDSAIQILNVITHLPRVDLKLKAQCKLDLGDLFLLTNEPWEATLLYSQVEKSNKSSKIGYEAKFRNARLNYYLGNFELAKSHLDILKTATTKEIANDAMELSLLIQNNTVLDTSDFVLKKYADIELLIFQNKKQLALEKYHQMLELYPSHSLVSNTHWQIANLYLELGEFENAILNLEVFQSSFSKDVYSDDAHFLKAKIYEENLKNTDLAMDLYKSFLIEHAGSVYVSEARKRFRRLRGDQVYQ